MKMNWNHSCRRVAELISQRMDEPLGLLDSVRLRLHLRLCGNCRNVEQQLLDMKDLAAGMFDFAQEADGEPHAAEGGGSHEAKLG
jgi:predicted anti-sigma-YlaC factor YlaD